MSLSTITTTTATTTATSSNNNNDDDDNDANIKTASLPQNKCFLGYLPMFTI